jgi:hypothetical protein
VSRRVSDSIFGENPSDTGQFTIDDALINFSRINQDTVRLKISDPSGTTIVEIPTPRF